jgi:hypothetical protein
MSKDLQSVCAELVVRSRAGDQNAMGLLVEVGKSAKAGSQRAIQSKRIIEDYISKNPPPKSPLSNNKITWSESIANYIGQMQSSFQGEDEELGICIIAILPYMGEFGVTTLSNGPKLDNDIINLIASSFPSDVEEHAFLFAIANADQNEKMMKNLKNLNKNSAYATLVGCIVGQAKKIQRVRLPETPISVLSKKAAADLGDN